MYWHDVNILAPFLRRTEEHISLLQIQMLTDNQWGGGTLFYYYVALGCLILQWNSTNRKWKSLLPSLTASLRFLVRSSHGSAQSFTHAHSEVSCQVSSQGHCSRKAAIVGMRPLLPASMSLECTQPPTMQSIPEFLDSNIQLKSILYHFLIQQLGQWTPQGHKCGGQHGAERSGS